MEITKKPIPKKIWIITACLVLAMAALALVYLAARPQVHQGQKSITVAITHGNGETKSLSLETKTENLLDALLEEDEARVIGTDGPYGLYMLTVDGETADEDLQQWWCLTKGGEEVATGVSVTPIADGDAFEIVLKTGW